VVDEFLWRRLQLPWRPAGSWVNERGIEFMFSEYPTNITKFPPPLVGEGGPKSD